jgi:type II secretory pathway component PulF
LVVCASGCWRRNPLLFVVAYAKRPANVDNFILRIPLAGNLVVQLSVAQATRSLATLLAGGITLVESWEIASESITNLELTRAVRQFCR